MVDINIDIKDKNIYSMTIEVLKNLKLLAVEFDKKYPDHIRNSEEIYTLSMIEGRIIKVNKTKIRNFNNFAAFRTLDDAKLACKILRPYIKRIFKKDEKIEF